MASPLFQAPPEEVAEKLAEGHDPQGIGSVVYLLDQKLQRSLLERLVTLWNLTGAEPASYSTHENL